VFDEEKAAIPPSFDKGLPQHRNSLDSDFNHKGHRKLKPATKEDLIEGNVVESNSLEELDIFNS
jgi:hypothetical protein